MFEDLLTGLTTVLQPFHLIVLFMGVFIGFLGGATPGISGTMLVIILIPVTYGMDATPAFLILTSIYASAVFSGAISAILFRTPGTPEAVMTTLDGYPMAKRGEAGKALGLAIFSSALGGIVGTVILIFLTPYLANIALRFSAAEYFAVAFLGLTVIAALSGKQVIKGIIGALFGLFIATIGIDAMSGTQRFTFGTSELTAGISYIPILIGLFAVAEILRKAQEDHSVKEEVKYVASKLPGLSVFKKLIPNFTRSSLLGTFIGILPGAGATTAAMLSYSEAVRWSKHPEKFGTGIPDGIAAPETANNAAAMGAFVPLLALGIPGSATTAVILGAFILHGIQPGPMLFTNETELVYSIFIGLLFSVLFILVLAKPFIAMFAQTLKIPYTVLGPLIIMFCVIGSFAVRNNVFDLWIMLAFGVLGYLFDKGKLPIAPIVLGVVLGPLAEEQFRRAVQMSGGDFTVFMTRPISAVLVAFAILSLFLPLLQSYLNKRKERKNQTLGT